MIDICLTNRDYMFIHSLNGFFFYSLNNQQSSEQQKKIQIIANI